MAKPINNTTTVNRLLREKGISMAMLGKASSCSRTTAIKALHPYKFHAVSRPFMHMIRTKTVELLTAMGWNGDPEDLWAEYDQLTGAAQSEDKEAA